MPPWCSPSSSGIVTGSARTGQPALLVPPSPTVDPRPTAKHPAGVTYPFEPKSNKHLRPGQFWSVPLSDGRFACGRVLSVPRDADAFVPASTRLFLAGLLDWVGEEPPSAENIAGSTLLRQGFAHVRTVRETGGSVLGYRALDLDGIEPYLWRTHGAGRDVWIYWGVHPVRPATEADASLPIMSTWGFNYIGVVAEAEFVQGLRTAL